MTTPMPLPSQSVELLNAMRSVAVDCGTVSTGVNAGGNTLSDNTKRWANDIHKNMLVKIISGAGVGMQALIASNTTNSMRIYTPWLGQIAAGDTYVIIGRDFYRDLIDALGGGTPISAANPLETHDPKVGSLISFEGTTTANGGGGGVNLVCADLAVLLADYNGLEVIITSGDYSGEARDINGTTLGGVVTPNIPFSGQILIGIDFVIAAVTTTPAEVAALTALVVLLMADVGDASASILGSLYAILGNPAQSFNTMVGYEGAVSLANKVTAVRAALLDRLTLLAAGGAGELTVARVLLLDQITALRLAELDAANIPADIDTLLTRLSAVRAGYLDNINQAGLLQVTAARAGYLDKLPNFEHEVEWSSTPAVDAVADVAAISLTAGTIIPTFPAGATRVRALLVANVHASNKAANTHNISIKVQGKKDLGAYGDLIDLTAQTSLGLVNSIGVSDGLCVSVDVTALVDVSASTYLFKFIVDSDNAGAVNYTSSFVLVLIYKI